MKKHHFGYLLCLSLFLSTGCGPKERSLSELNQIQENGRTNYIYEGEAFEGFALIEEAGQLIAKYTVVGGEFNGPAYFYDKENRLIRLETYRKGVLSGLYEAYFPDGTPRLSFNYLDGEKHGKYRVYFAPGQLKEQLTYDAGIIKGDNYLYYKDGKVQHHFHFNAKGERHGVWEKFHPNGNPKEYLVFKNGQLVAPIKRYDVNGKLLSYNLSK